MALIGYWDGPQGRWQRQQTRHSRIMCLALPGEPIQKRSGSAIAREIEIRQQVDEALREARWGTMSGPVALSVRFTTTNSQPPELRKLAKYLLDVLGTTSEHAQRHRRTLYRDDRQVKMLHVG